MAKVPLRAQFKRKRARRRFLYHWSEYLWRCLECDMTGEGNTLHVGTAHRTNTEKKEGFPHDVVVEHKDYGVIGPIGDF